MDLPTREAARNICERIRAQYSGAREREPLGLTQTLKKYAAISRQAAALSRSIRNMTVDEYRLAHQAVDLGTGDPFEGLAEAYAEADPAFLIPRQWHDSNNENRPCRLSEQLDATAAFFGALTPVLGHHFGFSVQKPDPGGRTKSVQLIVASARWRLVHISWQLFDRLPNLMPSGAEEAPLHEFIRLVHESVSGSAGNFRRELKGRQGYTFARRQFDERVHKLRLLGERYGWSTFQEMEDVLISRSRHPAIPIPSSVRESLKPLMDHYVELRTLLLAGPRAAA